MLLARASYFALDEVQARAVLGEVHAAVSNWRQVALGPEVGMGTAELDDFAPAFEHEQMDAAAALLGVRTGVKHAPSTSTYCTQIGIINP